MRNPSFCCLILLSLFFISCNSSKTIQYNYLANARDTSGKEALKVKVFEPVIQKNDLLSIQVYTSTTKSSETDPLYNLPATQSVNQSNQLPQGYLVDANGNIEFPRLGLLHVEGLTKMELANLIKSKITDLTNPSVMIRFLNFRITFLGEVNRPGTISIPYEKINILEAVGLAGDLPLTGKKDNVHVIREVNGKREMGTIDLTSKNVFESPYFNLMQNDIIIVDATKSKLRSYDQSIILQRVSFALTLITSAAIIYNIFK
ncbi:MAG: ABC transporter substrate-binding protein [Chitinophagaceae bacterium]